jgi:DNA-binding CsgD family transcriptional regulator
MNIQDNDILNKIIKAQSCIIKGRDLKVILHQQRNFYLEKTDADVITICMNDQDNVRPEYVMEEHRLFAHLLHKYIFKNKTLAWETFVHNHYMELMSGNKYFKTDDMYEIFKGILTKREATSFNKELEMKNAVMMSIYDYDGKEIIGIICFLFRKDIKTNIKKLEEMKELFQTLLQPLILFQTLLQPLYDKQYSIVYSKCVRVDEDFSLLTDQEKRITKKVLAGKSYVEIAKVLNISINTLKTHMKNIFNKYNVNSKIELYNKLNTQHF